MRAMTAGAPKDLEKQGLRRWLPLIAIALATVLFFALGLQRYLSLEALRANSGWLYYQVADHLTVALLLYLLAYAGVVTLSLPGATILTLAGGCLFGQWLATGVTVVAATIG